MPKKAKKKGKIKTNFEFYQFWWDKDPLRSFRLCPLMFTFGWDKYPYTSLGDKFEVWFAIELMNFYFKIEVGI